MKRGPRRLVRFLRRGTFRAMMLFAVFVAAPLTCFCAGWVPRPYVAPFTRCDDEITDEEVIAAIKSVPMHYATPTLVQHLSTANSGGAGAGPVTIPSGYVAPQIDIRLPNTCFAGNCLILALSSNDVLNYNTPTDDGGNTWVAGGTTDDTGNTQRAALFYSLNIAAGTRHITVTFSNWNAQGVLNDAGTFVAAICSEFCNVATSSAIDGTSVGNKTAGVNTTTFTSGAITTTASGDLMWAAFWIDNGNNQQSSHFTASTVTSAAFKLLSADIVDSFSNSCCIYAVTTGTGSINPTCTVGNTAQYVGVGIALKAAAAGQAAPAFSVVRACWCNQYNLPSGGGSTALNFQFPCTGNLLVMVSSTLGNSGGNYNLAVPQPATLSSPTPITDSASNTWAIADSAQSPTTISAAATQSAISYAANATTATTLTGTVTTSHVQWNCTMCFFDIQGAATSALGNHTNATGTQTVANATSVAGPLTTCTLTPSQNYSWCICTFSVDFGSHSGVNGVNSNNGDFLCQIQTCPQSNNTCGTGTTFAGTNTSALCEDQGPATVYNKTAAPQTYTFVGTESYISSRYPQPGGTNFYGAGCWSAAAAEFKSATPVIDTHPASITPTSVTLTGFLGGEDEFYPWICPQGTGSVTQTLWGQSGSGFTETTGTNVGGGGGKGGDCSTSLTGAFTPGNTYVLTCGGLTWATQGVDDNLVVTAALNGNNAASATGATTSFGTAKGGTSSLAGTGGATHTGGNGATGTSSGGGGGGGGGGPTGNGGTGAVTGGGTAGTGSPAAGAGGAGKASGSTGNGTAGNAPGGAGGGGFRASSGTGTGGAGKASEVIITATLDTLGSQVCL